MKKLLAVTLAAALAAGFAGCGFWEFKRNDRQRPLQLLPVPQTLAKQSGWLARAADWFRIGIWHFNHQRHQNGSRRDQRQRRRYGPPD